MPLTPSSVTAARRSRGWSPVASVNSVSWLLAEPAPIAARPADAAGHAFEQRGAPPVAGGRRRIGDDGDGSARARPASDAPRSRRRDDRRTACGRAIRWRSSGRARLQRALEPRRRTIRGGAQRRDLHPLVVDRRPAAVAPAPRATPACRASRASRATGSARARPGRRRARAARRSPAAAPASARRGRWRSRGHRDRGRPAPAARAAARGDRVLRASTARGGGRAPTDACRQGVRAPAPRRAGCRVTSRRCAVRRRQRLRCASASTSSASVADPSRGRGVRARRRCRGDDPVDASAVLAGGEHVGVLLQVARRPFRMLDVRTVVVDDVQRAVRTDVEVHRTEPAVGRGEELHVAGAPRLATKVEPFGDSTSRCTRLCTGSATNDVPSKPSGKAPPV